MNYCALDKILSNIGRFGIHFIHSNIIIALFKAIKKIFAFMKTLKSGAATTYKRAG